MQRVPEQQRGIHLEMMNPNLVIMPGKIQTQAVKPTMLVRKSPIHGVCTICMGTSGNGCRIYITIVTAVRPLMEVYGKKVALTGFIGAAAGAPHRQGLPVGDSRQLRPWRPRLQRRLSPPEDFVATFHFTPYYLLKLSQIVNKHDGAGVRQPPARLKKSVRRTAKKKYCKYFL